MAVVEEILRSEADGSISFGNHKLAKKAKVEDYEHAGDLLKVKTYNEMTKLEKNGMFLYESVPGTSVLEFKEADNSVEFIVEGDEDSQITADTKGAPSQTLPSWLPDDAPAPDPNSEISIVHFYINEDGETIVYDPETEVIPYSTAYGDAGTAAIYWVNRSQIYWGITSYTKGLMTFAGDVTTNRGGFYLLGDIEFDGSASGNIMGVTTKRGTNTATLSGFMIDAKGVSFTAPDVSSSLTY